jgi:hypothetical protein
MPPTLIWPVGGVGSRSGTFNWANRISRSFIVVWFPKAWDFSIKNNNMKNSDLWFQNIQYKKPYNKILKIKNRITNFLK